MSGKVFPVRLKSNRVFLPNVGLITLPRGIAIYPSPKNGNPFVVARGLASDERKHITISDPTVEGWMDGLQEAVKYLKSVRKRLLTSWPIKEGIEDGPVPGWGQPGVYGNEAYPAPRAYDPVKRELVYTSSLAEAERVRKAAEVKFFEHNTFNAKDLFSV